jgi:hypothetical protein
VSVFIERAGKGINLGIAAVSQVEEGPISFALLGD